MRTVQSCCLSSPMHHQLDSPSWRKGKESPKLEAEANLKPAESKTLTPKLDYSGSSTILGNRTQELGDNWCKLVWWLLCFYMSPHLALFQVLDGSFQCNSPAPACIQTSFLCLSRWADRCRHQKLQQDKHALLPRGRTTVLAMWTQLAEVRLESTAGYKKPSKGRMISFLPLLYFLALPHPSMTFTDWQPTTAEIPILHTAFPTM